MTDQANEILTNQTTFFDEEVLLTTPPSLPVQHDPHKAEKEASRKKQTRLFITLGTVGVCVVIVGVAITSVLTPSSITVQNTVPSPIVLSSKTDQSEMTKRLDELEQDVREADPFEVSYPFPAVSLDLYLDQQSRR